MSGDLALLLDAAHEAGALALAMRAKGLTTEYKVGDSPVTDADLATDALLKDRLRAARPEYGWLSEETADNDDRLACRRLFVVDSIDGTRAFIKDRPWWTVCLSVVEASRPVAAVVFAPQLDETYAAEAGGGSTLNGAPIRAGRAVAVEDCRMIGDPAMFAHPAWPIPWPAMRIESRNSTAYRMCLVAADAADVTVRMPPQFDWDVAAADLIATEAGAVCCDHRGRAFAYNGPVPQQRGLVCAAPALAPLILERLAPIAVRN